MQCRLLPFNSAQQGGARLIVKSDDDAGGWQVRVKGHGGTSVNAANTHRTSQGFLCHGGAASTLWQDNIESTVDHRNEFTHGEIC